jgi:choline dehydrogenase
MDDRPHGGFVTTTYDVVICGAGSAGSALAGRLAAREGLSVLLIEAGGSDEVAPVMIPEQWFLNLDSERDWSFRAEPGDGVAGRALPLAMGKVLGGGSSINVLVWARGHRTDWDRIAKETGDLEWGYEAVLGLYRRIEDWAGTPDPRWRGTGGPMRVELPVDPSHLAPALVAGAVEAGLPAFEHSNGEMMEGPDGVALTDMIIRNGRRQSVFRSYVVPTLGRSGLRVLTNTTVTRVLIEKGRAVGVEIVNDGQIKHIRASLEVVLSTGAVHTPKLLMQSGIGAADDLRGHGIPVIADLPGVGRNYQDHIAVSAIWESPDPVVGRNNLGETIYYARSDSAMTTPDTLGFLVEAPLPSEENAARFGVPEHAWSIFQGISRPHSRGRITLTGPNPGDPVRIEAAALSDPEDLRAAVAGIELAREIGNSRAMRPFARREVMPGPLPRAELEDFVRNGAGTYRHQSCTAKMGRDELAVVDSTLKVRGVEGLRVADASVLPRVTSGNTMAPCVVIGERASDLITRAHAL